MHTLTLPEIHCRFHGRQQVCKRCAGELWQRSQFCPARMPFHLPCPPAEIASASTVRCEGSVSPHCLLLWQGVWGGDASHYSAGRTFSRREATAFLLRTIMRAFSKISYAGFWTNAARSEE